MSAFVILAAGRGNRMGRIGDELPKCLAPLDGRAVLSHQLELAPGGSTRLVICVGYRSEQVLEYLELAHPDLGIDVVHVRDWGQPHAGPGASLLAARDAIGNDDMFFTSCDTLWDVDPTWPTSDTTWMGVAPIPPGTPPARWCRVTYEPYDGVDYVTGVVDKRSGHEDSLAYVGLGHVARAHVELFWDGVALSQEIAGELQVSGGFQQILDEEKCVEAVRVHWTDVGDETAYRQAVARYSGYDWVKAGQGTYVLPTTGCVVKYHTDRSVLVSRALRGADLYIRGAAPPSRLATTMLAIDYVPGNTVYDAIDIYERQNLADTAWWTERLLNWVDARLRDPVDVPASELATAGMRFYRDKTLDRIEQLDPELRFTALDAVSRVNWDALVRDVQPVIWHGDLNFGNVIVNEHRDFVAIDWREDFAGHVNWGDARYDIAKLLAGTVVHWDRARRGDFRPWESGRRHAELIRASRLYTDDCEIIGALSLISSAPLHAPPLDEILVARACAWLDDVL